MKKILWLVLLNVFVANWLTGQSSVGKTGGFNFQALARSTTGKILALQPLNIRVSLYSSRQMEKKTLYLEAHRVTADALGLISLQIGTGVPVIGDFSELPWSSVEMWMEISLLDPAGDYVLIHNAPLRAVPYALYAEKAGRLSSLGGDAPEEKQQSIFWITSGNTLTKPETHFVGTRDNQDLYYKTQDIQRGRITKEGQFVIDVDPVAMTSGAITPLDKQKTSYPLTVEGSANGIHVKVNGSRSESNHFLSFGDDMSVKWGAVKGQTTAELHADWTYVLRTTGYALGIATYSQVIAASTSSAAINIASGNCAAALVLIAWQAPGYYAGAVADGLFTAASSTGLANLVAERNEWSTAANAEVGVTYSSGYGDYAEWLERDPAERDLQIGEIVGVRGGVTSLKTEDADHVMVVSTAPAFLGNQPRPGDEYRFEKVAFMGQVNVRVAGKVNAGDYIIASGKNDGMGIAVRPADMQLADYRSAVGIAWEAAGDSPVNMVKIGVGLDDRGMATKVAGISQKVDNILAYLEGEAPLKREQNHLEQGRTKNIPFGKRIPDEQFDAMLEQSAAFLKTYYSNVERQIKAAGGEISDPVLAEIIRDPVAAGKAMRRDPKLESYWAYFDQMYLKK